MISKGERTVASFGIGFIVSLLSAIIFFFIDKDFSAGYFSLPLGLIGAILYEKYDQSQNSFQKYKNYGFGILGAILPSVIAGF